MSGIAVDFTINVGVLVQTALILFGGAVALGVMRSTVQTIKEGVAQTKIESAAHFQRIDNKFEAVHREIKDLNSVLISIARFEERISSLDTRVTMHTKQIDDLRRGDGYVQRPSRQALDGEYPEPPKSYIR